MFQARRTATTKVPNYDTVSSGILRKLGSVKGRVVKGGLGSRQWGRRSLLFGMALTHSPKDRSKH